MRYKVKGEKGALSLSVVLQGVLVQCEFGVEDDVRLIRDDKWLLPVMDWREVPFVVEKALALKSAHEASSR